MVSKTLLVGIIALIIIAIVAMSFFTQPLEITFTTGFNEIKAIWASKGIQIDEIDTEYEKIPLLSSQQLFEVKTDLEKYKTSLDQYSDSSSKQTLLKLTDIYLNLTNSTILEKSINNLEDQISNVSVLAGCENISLFNERNSLRREMVNETKKLSDNVNSYVSTNSAENEITKFIALDYDFDAIEQDMKVKEDSVTSLEENC